MSTHFMVKKEEFYSHLLTKLGSIFECTILASWNVVIYPATVAPLISPGTREKLVKVSAEEHK